MTNLGETLMAERDLLNLKQLINRNVQAVMPQEDQKENFKKNITDYITKLEGLFTS